jgi:hypothetical protein
VCKLRVDVSGWPDSGKKAAGLVVNLTIGGKYDAEQDAIIGPTPQEWVESGVTNIMSPAPLGTVTGGMGKSLKGLLSTFTENRLGKAPGNVNCYGCVLKEWFEHLGKPAAIDDLTPNPWGKELDTFLDFGANKPGSDLVESAVRTNFDQIAGSDLMVGDVVMWQKEVTGFFNLPGTGPTTHQHVSHIGIYAGDGQVFSKLGSNGAYEFRNLTDPFFTEQYGTPSFWRMVE